jgi:hypothetical protein
VRFQHIGICGMTIAIILVPYSSFPFPHLWTGTRSSVF